MRAAALLACLILGACASTGPAPMTTSNTEAAPAEWRELAAAYVRTTAKDPGSIKDAAIAPPVRDGGPSLIAGQFVTPWVVCVRMNARNSFGGYTGPVVYQVRMAGGRVLDSVVAGSFMDACQGAAFAPFPELEA